jgi:hypothetical protein
MAAMDGAAANGPGDDLPRHEYGNLYPRDLDTCTRSKTELYREAAARVVAGEGRDTVLHFMKLDCRDLDR